MKLKASVDYGMRTVLYLAAQNTTCSSKDIAERMSIPRDYLIQLAQLLRNADIIEAHPGKHGGYRLAKPPNDVSVLEVMNALGEDNEHLLRSKRAADAEGEITEDINETYCLIKESMDTYLDSLSIGTLLTCVKNGGDRNKILAECLLDESRRLDAIS